MLFYLLVDLGSIESLEEEMASCFVRRAAIALSALTYDDSMDSVYLVLFHAGIKGRPK